MHRFIVLNVLKTLLQQDEETKKSKETTNLITGVLKTILGWGGRSYRSYRYHSNNYGNPYAKIIDPIGYWDTRFKETKKEDEEMEEYKKEDIKDEDASEDNKRSIAPKEMQESLQKVATTHRSPIEREQALKRLDEPFLIEQVKNPKQHVRVKEYALRLLVDDKSKAIDDFAQDTSLSEDLRTKALQNTTNKKILKQAVKEGNTDVLFKLDLKDILDLPKEVVLKALTKDSRYSWRNDDAFDTCFKKASPATRKEFMESYADKIDNDTAINIMTPFIKDKKLLPKIYDKCKDLKKATIIRDLKDDKVFLTKILKDSKEDDSIRLYALNLLGGNDPKFYKKILSEIDNSDIQNACLFKIDDEKILKEWVAKKEFDPIPEVYEKIKDQDFLKELYKTKKDKDILRGVEDSEYIKNLYTKTSDPGYLEYIDDDKFLKQIYQDNLKKVENRQDKENLAAKRHSALTNIKDQDFLQTVAKKDPSFEVRLQAVKLITDPKILEALILRESSKTVKSKMIDVIENQDVLMAYRRKEKDPDLYREIDNKLTPESIVTLLKEDELRGGLISTYVVEKVDKDILKPILKENYEYAEAYISMFYKDEKYLLEIIKAFPDMVSNLINHIKDQKVLTKLFESHVSDISGEGVDNLTDPKLLKMYLLKNGESNVLEAFQKLNPSQEDLLEIINTTISREVKAQGIKLLSDVKIIKEYLLQHNTPEVLKNAWDKVKDDKEFLVKLVSASKNPDIIKIILPKMKGNDAVLKKIINNIKDQGWSVNDLFDKAVSMISDKNYIKKILFGMDKHRLKGLLEVLPLDDVKASILETDSKNFEDIDRVLDNLLDSGIDYLEIFNKSKNEVVKLVASLYVSPENYTDEVREYINKSLFHLKGYRFNDLLDKMSLGDIKSMLLTTDANNFEKIENTIRNDDAKGSKGFDQKDLLEIYNKSTNDVVKSAVVLYLDPKSFTKEMVSDFTKGMSETQVPYKIDPLLKRKAYEWGSEAEQDALKGFVDKQFWNERHREAMDRPYLQPEKSRRGTIGPIEHDIEKNPNYQLYRLLVLIAK